MNLLQCYYNLQLYIISLGPQLPPLKIDSCKVQQSQHGRESCEMKGEFLVYTSPRMPFDSRTQYPSIKDKLMLTVHSLLLYYVESVSLGDSGVYTFQGVWEGHVLGSNPLVLLPTRVSC